MSKRKRLDECRQLLEQPDSVLNSDVQNTVARFIESGGLPSEALELLSDNFKGYPQMTNILCEWMELMGHSRPATEKLITEYLASAITERFSKERADSAFEKAHAQPVWLDEMIQDPTWRGLLYKLSGANKNCLLLDFAIQQISDAGHQQEIAASTAVASDLAVFGGVLETELVRLHTLPPDSLQVEFDTFVRMASQSQSTYLLAQVVLLRAQELKPSTVLSRLQQVIRVFVS